MSKRPEKLSDEQLEFCSAPVAEYFKEAEARMNALEEVLKVLKRENRWFVRENYRLTDKLKDDE